MAVVAIAVGGRVFSGPRSAPVVGGPVVAAEGDAVPSAPAATPSPRSDWPAAMSGEAAPTPHHRPREEGTDGLMGRLVFGLPNDTPYPPDQVDWSTIHDERADWSKGDAVLDSAPWVRRLQGLSNFRTDPYQR